MTGVEIFTKQQFEDAIAAYDYKPLGVVQHNYAYDIDFGNPNARIRVYSSVAPNGSSRDCGEDSIRAWLVSPTGAVIGGKTQKYVKRTKNWRIQLAQMIHDVANLGRWIQPCPKCQQMLDLTKKGDTVYIYCPEDARNRDNPQHQRHIPLKAIEKKTGEEKPQHTPAPKTDERCPTCGTQLVKVTIRQGKNAGKQALTCPKKENGAFLNHVFKVL